MRDPIKILVADRNALVVEALEDLFMELNGGSPVLSAGSLEEALTITRSHQPELIVVDAWMSANADHAVRTLVELAPRSTLFVMATNCDSEFELRMIAAGATGCYEKEEMPACARSILETARARQ